MTRASAEAVALATKHVVAMYVGGVGMRAISDKTGISRTTIRKIVQAAEVPRRPTGKPRMAVTSQAIADLYESGLTMTQVAKQLQIKPNAAWARYIEVRDQRGITLSRWHQVLLAALEESPAIVVVATAAAYLRREPTSAEAHAARRAARALARVGVASADHVNMVRNGRNATYLILTRPGIDAATDSKQQLRRLEPPASMTHEWHSLPS